MATYYVSNQRGNDTNNGTSPSTPWKTMTKAVQTLVAGDTVYVGSGTYRETLTHTKSGTSAKWINFIGDPDSEYVIGDKEGVVRVTGCDENEVMTYGNLWNRGSYSYIKIKNFQLDGKAKASDDYSDPALLKSSYNDNINESITMYASGVVGIIYGTSVNCIVIHGGDATGFSSGIQEKCIVIGSMYGFMMGKATNCIAIGCNSTGFVKYDSPATNCIAIGCSTGFSITGSQTVPSVNCVAIACRYGFAKIAQDSIAINCGTGYGESYMSTDMPVTNCWAWGCGTIKASKVVGEVSNGLPMFFNTNIFNDLINAFEPSVVGGIKQWGNNTVDAGITDILGKPRKMLGGLLDVGAYAISDIKVEETVYYSQNPSICITQKGQKYFEVPANANETITIKVQTMFNGSVTNKPQILLRGSSITEQVSTNTSSANSWQQLTVSATPTKDEILTLVLYNQGTTSDSKAYFSDISIS